MILKHKVAIVTNIIPSYREQFYLYLFFQESIYCHVYCEKVKDRTVETQQNSLSKITYVDSIGFESEILGFQFLPFWRLLNDYDCIVIDGNPRTLSNVVLFLLAKLFRRKTVIWTTFHSYSAKRITEYLRLKYTSLFRNILTYTECDVQKMRKFGMKQNRIIALNNGLNQAAIDLARNNILTMNFSIEEKKKFRIVSVARLIKKNRFDLLLSALELLKKEIDFECYIIGGGPEFTNLEFQIANLQLIDQVRLLGPLYDEQIICEYLFDADVFIHPHSVGLSLMHAYGYGLPVIIDDKFDEHGPEICFFSENVNGISFKFGSVDDLTSSIKHLIFNSELRAEIGKRNLFLVQNICNTEKMAHNFMSMLEVAK